MERAAKKEQGEMRNNDNGHEIRALDVESKKKGTENNAGAAMLSEEQHGSTEGPYEDVSQSTEIILLYRQLEINCPNLTGENFPKSNINTTLDSQIVFVPIYRKDRDQIQVLKGMETARAETSFL